VPRSTRKRTGTEIALQPCTVDDLRHHEKLFEMHWEEVATHKAVLVLNPDWKRYYELEERGMLLLLAAWKTGADNRNELAGYSVTFLLNHLHYMDLTYAQNDLLFVHPDYRSAGIGLHLIRLTETVAKQRGARFIMWHAKRASSLEALLPNLGYQIEETTYSKEMTDG
jgi:GNAT superfamily N-acetyltransferase